MHWGPLFAIILTTLAVAAPGAAQGRPAFFKDSRGDLALARARGDSAVTLIVAARRGRSAEVAGVVARLGGQVQRRVATIDYLRVRVALAHAETVAALPGVEAAGVSAVVPASRPRRAYTEAERESAGDTTRRKDPDWPPRLSRYPLEHPYTPLADLGAAEWRTAHPTWDGRGVTIADIEWTPDLLATELQAGLTLEGKPVRKFVDVRTAVAPTTVGDSSSAYWLRMREAVEARGRRFTHRGRAYTAPGDGRFRIDALHEGVFKDAHTLGGDLNRDGNPPGGDSLFAVLWDERRNTVWVDTDQDGDFTDERPLTDYGVRGDIGVLGTDNPSTPVRESVGFAVQIDRPHRAVALNLGIGAHATTVIGAAAGARGENGKYDGVAPGAQLASISYGKGSPAALTEALIMAFADPRIDVIVLEQNVYIFDLVYRPVDGRSVSSIICARLIERYRKPFLVPGGNAPGLSQVGEHTTAAGAIGVGAYQGAESYRVNVGVVPAQADNLHIVGSGGPSGNGALKPDILSPSGVLSNNVGYAEADGVAGLFSLPPRYRIGNGTSTATPVAAGAVALLISAAKQSGIPYDAERLRRALLTTARYLEHIPTFEQGNGLLQVSAAWEALARMAEDSSAASPITIEVQASVRTAVSDWLTPAHTGPGLYEVGGWTAGQRGERTLVLTRTSGPKDPRRLMVRWRGAGGTFTSRNEVVLPLGTPIELPVSIAPPAEGAHSAVLELVDRSTDVAVHRISCVIVVPLSFTGPAYTLTVRDSVPRPGRHNLFFDVPPGVGALTLDFTDVKGDLRAALTRPDGRSGGHGPLVDSTGGIRYVPRPEPGVWQLSFMGSPSTMHRDQQPDTSLGPSRFSVKMSLASVAVEVDTVVAGRQATAAARNRMAALPAAMATAPLASGAAARRRLGPGAQHVYTVDVPAGSTLLLARVTPHGAPKADVDLYLFDCTKAQCVPAGVSADVGSAPSLARPRPAAGTWKLVVDAARLSGDSVTYDYLDLVLNPTYGATAVGDPMAERAPDTAWNAPAHAWRVGPVASPRRPYAAFLVEDGRLAHADPRWVPLTDRVPLAWTAVLLDP